MKTPSLHIDLDIPQDHRGAATDMITMVVHTYDNHSPIFAAYGFRLVDGKYKHAGDIADTPEGAFEWLGEHCPQWVRSAIVEAIATATAARSGQVAA